MLQPSQIDTVSLHYGAEIADVRSFLRSVGVTVETPAALNDVVKRLESNRAFHRDLGSHAWMLLYSGATVPETLAVLVVATLGPRFAATADEDSTHDILRFVMESRSQLNGKSGERFTPVAKLQSSAVAETTAAVAPTRDERRASVFAGESPVPVDAPVLVPAPLAPVPTPSADVPATPVPAEMPSGTHPAAVHQAGCLRSITPAIAVADTTHDATDDAEEDVPLAARPDAHAAREVRSSRGVLLAAAACLLLFAVAVGWFFLHRSSAAPATATQPAPVVDGTTSPVPDPLPAVPVAPLPERAEQSVTHTAARTPSAGREPRWNASAPVSRYAQPTPRVDSVPAPMATRTQPPPDYRADSSTPAPITRVAPAPAAGSSTTPTIRPYLSASRTASSPVSNSVLSTRLGSPTVNQADAVDDRVAGTKGYPRLLRRKALDANGTLVAKATPVTLPGTRMAALPSGTVRSTSLGVSAGNLVYAPDPAYPPDAAMQHVSGQVKLEAMVDREGNVASARVISGPPMLRDAAVSAVQQWRYRPYRTGGKPQTFTATAVMDFQLQ